MTRGEALQIKQDYDLFGVNVNSFISVYLKTDATTGKHMVYFLELEEWAEFDDDFIERVEPDHIPAIHKEFIGRVIPLKITCLTP
jgi:hypothetical protein|tara:strand:+ start:150 stop:404 length:255 start_codon:yes stop_codon:yes gene_type:complete